MTPLRTPLCLALFAALPLMAHADDVADKVTDAKKDPTTLDTVSVVGQNATRQVQQLGKLDIQQQTPGTSPLQMLQRMPGVHFVSNEPFGTDEWSSRISLRGFNHTQLGYTLDGIPLGNADYHTGDGLSVTRAWIGESLGELDLSQGSGALGTASTSNLGGTVQLHTDDPSRTPGVRVNATGGSYGFKRGYIRGDIGEHDGFSAYVAGMYVDAPKWKGDDGQRQRQFIGKAIYDWTGGRITGIVDVVRRTEQAYLDLSKDSLRRCGYRFDYLAPDWQRSVDIANGKYSGCVTSADDTYFNGNGIRQDEIGSVKGEFFLSDNLTLNVQPYYHHDLGQGHWYAPKSDLPYTPAPGDAPIALRLSHYLMTRGGIMNSLEYQLGEHHLQAGFWFEDSHYTIARSFQAIPDGGPISQDRIYDTYDNVLFRQRFMTLTRQWYIEDDFSLLDDRLHIDGGFKGHNVTTNAIALLPGRASGALTARSDFLPQIAANYRLGGGWETFASFQVNQNAYEPGANGAWSSDQKTFDGLSKHLRPERSANSELGVRYVDDTVQSSLALYNIDFKNRLLVIVPCAGVVSCPNQIANVGKVNARGAEFTVVWQPTRDVRWFNSATYNDAKYKDNYLDGGVLVPTRGKTVVDSPKKMLASEVSYRFGDVEAKLGAKYTGARYYTYVNDQRIGGFTLFDAGLTWNLGRMGSVQSTKVSLTVSNLLGRKYVATIDSNGFTTSDPNGTFQTLLVGAPRQGFLTVDMTF